MSLAHDQARIDAMATRIEEAQRRRAKQTPHWRLATRLFRDYRRH